MFRITQQSLQALGCLIIFFIKFQNLIFSKRCGFIILFILEIFQQLLKVFLFGRKFLLILPSPPKYQSKVYVPFGYASVNRFTVPRWISFGIHLFHPKLSGYLRDRPHAGNSLGSGR